MQVLIIVLQKILLQVSACLVFKIHTRPQVWRRNPDSPIFGTYLIFAEAESHENEKSLRPQESWLVRAEKRQFSKRRAEKFSALSMSLGRDLNGVVVAIFHLRYLLKIKHIVAVF